MKNEILTLYITDARFNARIGVFAQERTVGNEFAVDIALGYRPCADLRGDDLAGLISYADVYDIAAGVMGKERRLMESAAREIIDATLARWPEIYTLEVKITKMRAPISGFTGKAAVSLSYSKAL